MRLLLLKEKKQIPFCVRIQHVLLVTQNVPEALTLDISHGVVLLF